MQLPKPPESAWGAGGGGAGFSRMLAGGRGVTVKERTEEAQSRVGSGLA